MKRYKDLVYARVGERSLQLDLYLPGTGEGPFPVIVWVHGGAWRRGDRLNPPSLTMVRHGYATVSVAYRLSGEAIFPAQIHDCKAAVRWVRANAGRYNLDPAHVGAWGASAGGHLVALLGVSAGVPELEGDLGNLDRSSAVDAVCDWFGPSDFLHMNDRPGAMDHDAPDSPESQLIGAPIRSRPDLVARANPITYVTPEAAPFLLMHGTADDVVLPNQSAMLHAALVAAGVPATLVNLGGLGHGFGCNPVVDGAPADLGGGRCGEIYGIVRAFFDAYLKT
jgi:acetyl esterase/lipase